MGTQPDDLTTKLDQQWRYQLAKHRLRLLALDRRRIGGDCIAYWRAFRPAPVHAETPLHDGEWATTDVLEPAARKECQ